jgi:predicted negative regulator of RcsB-dependent stress response
MAELDQKTYDAITAHCARGDALAEKQAFDAAIAEYARAWALVPEPKNDWEAATWILAAMADSHFLAGNAAKARDVLAYAMTCPDAVGNPFLHLRFGEVSFDLGDRDRAADELMRAFMGAGPEIFANENPKYLAFLKTRARV